MPGLFRQGAGREPSRAMPDLRSEMALRQPGDGRGPAGQPPLKPGWRSNRRSVSSPGIVEAATGRGAAGASTRDPGRRPLAFDGEREWRLPARDCDQGDRAPQRVQPRTDPKNSSRTALGRLPCPTRLPRALFPGSTSNGTPPAEMDRPMAGTPAARIPRLPSRRKRMERAAQKG